MNHGISKNKTNSSFSKNSMRVSWFLRSYLIASKKRFIPTRDNQEINSVLYGPESPSVSFVDFNEVLSV